MTSLPTAISLLLLLLGMATAAGCGGEPRKAPSGGESTTGLDVSSQAPPPGRVAVDWSRPAPAYEAEVATQEAEADRARRIDRDRKRVVAELAAARGDEAALRGVVERLRARWRATDPDRYARQAARLAATLNSRGWGVGESAAKTMQRDVALDALALGNSVHPAVEAYLAQNLSRTVRFEAEGTRAHAIHWRRQFAMHWLRAWSRLRDELATRRTPPPKTDSRYRRGPFPDGLSPTTNGSAPPYLLDAGERADYDQRLATHYAGLRENRRREEIKVAMERSVPMLRRDLIRSYRLKPRDDTELRSLLTSSSLSREEQALILEEVGAR